MLQKLVNDIKDLQEDDFVFVNYSNDDVSIDFRCYRDDVYFGDIGSETEVGSCTFLAADFTFTVETIMEITKLPEGQYKLESPETTVILVF